MVRKRWRRQSRGPLRKSTYEIVCSVKKHSVLFFLSFLFCVSMLSMVDATSCDHYCGSSRNPVECICGNACVGPDQACTCRDILTDDIIATWQNRTLVQMQRGLHKNIAAHQLPYCYTTCGRECGIDGHCLIECVCATGCVGPRQLCTC